MLGAQATGGDGVDKRVDAIATAIRAGLTVDDLADLELAYSPPFGSAKDPVNLAGMVASKLLAGTQKIRQISYNYTPWGMLKSRLGVEPADCR